MFLDVVIKGESQWPILLITLFVGFGGVTLGAVLSGGFELWRRALNGQSAARLIRVETIENRLRADKLLLGAAVTGAYETSAWQAMRLEIAPFLSELELARLAESYAKLEDMRTLTDEPSPRLFMLKPDGKQFYVDWMLRTKEVGKVLRRVEGTAPSQLGYGLIKRKRVATIEEIETEFGLSATDPVAKVEV